MISYAKCFVKLSLVATAAWLPFVACGGVVEAGHDTPSTTYPAFAIDNPQVEDRGGPVLAAPHVVAFFSAGDPNEPAALDFLSALGASAYWGETAGMYGVGAIPSVAEVTTDLSEIAGFTTVSQGSALAAELAESYYASPPPGTRPSTVTTAGGATLHTDTLFVIVSPVGIDCSVASGFHDEAALSDGSRVAWAVVMPCPDASGALTVAEHMNLTAAHELIGGATDPFPTTAPAFLRVDDAHAAWAFSGGLMDTELADLCENNRIATVVGGQSMILAPIWSNTAAAAGHGRCAPSTETAATPELLAMPVFSDSVPFEPGITTRGVTLADGASTTIDVRLVSDGPTPGPWFVRAKDMASVDQGRAAQLDFSFDRTQGVNGDVLHLTIKRVAPPIAGVTIHGDAFKLQASLTSDFASAHDEYGFVADP